TGNLTERPARDALDRDLDEMVAVVRSPGFQRHTTETYELRLVPNFARVPDHEHAPSGLVVRGRAVDLESDHGAHQRRTELRSGRGPQHDRSLEHGVVHRKDGRECADAEGDPSEAL